MKIPRKGIRGEIKADGEERNSGSIEVEGELMVVGRVRSPNLSQCVAGRLAHAVSIEPFLHPDMAAFGLPDFGQLQGAATAGTLQGVVAEAGCDALAPGEVLECLEQGLEGEQRELETERIQGSLDEVGEFAFDIAGIETSVAHHLHALGRDVRDQRRDEVEGRAGHGLTLTGGGVDVPVRNLQPIVGGQVGKAESLRNTIDLLSRHGAILTHPG